MADESRPFTEVYTPYSPERRTVRGLAGAVRFLDDPFPYPEDWAERLGAGPATPPALSIADDGSVAPVTLPGTFTPIEILRGIDFSKLIGNVLRPPMDTSGIERACGALTGIPAESFDQTFTRLLRGQL